MYGNKAKNLQKLKNIGLNVPDFYVIPSTTIQNLNENIIESLIRDFESWSKEYNCMSVAVRSSAEEEDSDNKSYAGQFISVMPVTNSTDFIKALRKVASSKPFKGYKLAKQYSVNAIVQLYIEPDIAGVIFSVNPASGQSEMLINAVKGHGSKVVDGKDSNSIHVNRPGGDIRYANNISKNLISPKKIKELTNAVLLIEKELTTPQDIEWALVGDKFYYLQTRPITVINHLRLWDNANLGESFPGIVLPLTFSISRRGYELVYKSQGYAAGLNWYQLEENQRTFNAMVGIFAGRMYYNLSSWYKFIGFFPNNNQNQKYLDDQLQTIGNAVYLPPSNYPISYRINFYFRIMRRTILFNFEKRKYWRQLKSKYEDFENMPHGNDLFSQMDRYAFIEQKVIPIMGRSADNDFFVMIYHGILKKKLSVWLNNSKDEASNFLGSLHNVISARQAVVLSEIAEYIKNDETASNLLKNTNYIKLDNYILNSNAKDLLIEYRDTFLHRFAEDQKLEVANPLLKLSGFYELIQSYTKLNNKTISDRRNIAMNAESERSIKLQSSLKLSQRILYKLLISRLKKHLRIREQNRLLRGKAYAYLRELFIEVSENLTKLGLIESAKDIYYLEIEELFKQIDGTGFENNLKQIISFRKQKYSGYRKLSPPARFITTGLTNTVPADFLTHKSINTTNKHTFKGTISSPGTIEGKVIVLEHPIIPKVPFDILVVSHTDPGWTPLIALAKGLIVEHGGILSHASIVTRELGIPSIIGVEDITQHLKNGMNVRINTSSQSVELLAND